MWEVSAMFQRFSLHGNPPCQEVASNVRMWKLCWSSFFLQALWSVKLWKITTCLLPPLIFLSRGINCGHCLLQKKCQELHLLCLLPLKAYTWRFNHDFPFDTLLFGRKEKRGRERKRGKTCGGVKEWSAASWGKWGEHERDKCRESIWKGGKTRPNLS